MAQFLALFSSAPVDQISLERLDGDRRVAEIFESQLVEIISTDIDVEVFAPIVLDALVDDIVGGRKFLDFVRAAAERHVERGFLDAAFLAVLVGAFPPVLRKDGELADNLRQFATASPVEREGDFTVAGLFCLDDVTITCAGLRTYFLECIEGENHVVRRDRLAVLPFCFRAKSKGDRRDILRKAHGFGEKPVCAGYFVERRHQEGVIDLKSMP